MFNMKKKKQKSVSPFFNKIIVPLVWIIILLAIFAGACQSYYEAIMKAGANFASSPARILIDFIDPLIVAENIAIADRNNFVSIKNFENELRDGQKGISGIGSFGKKNE